MQSIFLPTGNDSRPQLPGLDRLDPQPGIEFLPPPGHRIIEVAQSWLSYYDTDGQHGEVYWAGLMQAVAAKGNHAQGETSLYASLAKVAIGKRAAFTVMAEPHSLDPVWRAETTGYAYSYFDLDGITDDIPYTALVLPTYAQILALTGVTLASFYHANQTDGTYGTAGCAYNGMLVRQTAYAGAAIKGLRLKPRGYYVPGAAGAIHMLRTPRLEHVRILFD
jgi:hypothetical protein